MFLVARPSRSVPLADSVPAGGAALLDPHRAARQLCAARRSHVRSRLLLQTLLDQTHRPHGQ